MSLPENNIKFSGGASSIISYLVEQIQNGGIGGDLSEVNDQIEAIATELNGKASAQEVQAVMSQLADKAQQAYVDTVLSSIADGSPNEVFYSLASLISTYPSGSIGTKLVFDSSHTDGTHSYLWNGTTWQDLGVYQSTGIADSSVTPEKLSFMETSPNINLLDRHAFIQGQQLFSSGLAGANPDYYLSPLINVDGLNDIATFIPYNLTTTVRCAFYSDLVGATNLSVLNTMSIGQLWTTPVPSGAKTFRFHLSSSYYDYMIASEVIAQVQSGQIITDYPQFGVSAVSRIPSKETKEARGTFSTLKERLESQESNIEVIMDSIDIPGKTVTCWGDSLTMGAVTGSNNYPFTNKLSEMLGNQWAITNAGVGGETANTILGRQGSIPIIVEPFSIPATTDYVPVTIKGIDGKTVNPGYYGSINPCYINGVKGQLDDTDGNNQHTRTTWRFKRITAGTAVQVTRPTPIITEIGRDHRDDSVQIFYIGQNGGYADVNDLINMYRVAIDYANTDKYLIIGMTTSNLTSAMRTALFSAFGGKFVDLKDYFIKYGLGDAGITPTSQDTTDIENGIIPSSLRSDDIHYNNAGYDAMGAYVYKRGQWLGYW